jgi:hypothetical protein
MVLIYVRDLLSFSSRFIDDLNRVQSFVSLLVFISCLLYAIVCLNKSLKSVTYKHLALDSIVTVIYSIINCSSWIIRCGALCPYGYNFWSKMFDLYIFIYVRQSLDTFMMLIEIHLTYVKLQSFQNELSTSAKQYIPLYVRFILFYIYSAAICVPSNVLPRIFFPGSEWGISLVGYMITSDNPNVTALNANESDLRPLYQLLSLNKDSEFMQWNLISGFMAGIGPLFVYLAMQIVLYLKLREFLAKKKRTLGADRDRTIEKSEIKSCVRILVLGINCFLGYFPNKLANNFLLYALTSQQWSLYIPFSNMLIWLSNGLKLFINLAFDEEFRRVFTNTFHIPFRKPRIMVSSSYGIASTAVTFTKRNNN